MSASATQGGYKRGVWGFLPLEVDLFREEEAMSLWRKSVTLILSERELLYDVAHPSVCRLSVTLVRPTQMVEIFGHVSTPFGTLATRSHSQKIFVEIVPGEPPPVGGLNARGVAKYSNF